MTLKSNFLIAAAATFLISAGPATSEDVDANTVLVTVNGTEITLGHMIALRSNLPAHYDQLSNEVLFDGILNQLVQHELLAQSLGDTPSRRSVLTIENESRAIKAGEASDAVAGADIPEEDIQAAYQRDYVEVDPETEYNAAHILVETEEDATSLVEKLNEGADFAKLAQEFSTGPSGPGGGDLGWFGKGVMVPEFFEAVTELEVGGVSDPVQTQFGWHLIKLNETRSQDRPDLEDVREQLEMELREAAFDSHVENLEKTAAITRADTSSIDPAILTNADLLEP